MRREEGPNRSVKMLRVDGRCVDMTAANLHERFVSARRVIQAPSFANRNDRIFRAVQKQDGCANAIDLVERVEWIAHQQSNGEERILLLSNGAERGGGSLTKQYAPPPCSWPRPPPYPT